MYEEPLNEHLKDLPLRCVSSGSTPTLIYRKGLSFIISSAVFTYPFSLLRKSWPFNNSQILVPRLRHLLPSVGGEGTVYLVSFERFNSETSRFRKSEARKNRTILLCQCIGTTVWKKREEERTVIDSYI